VNVTAKAARIKLLLFDVDGVLTDGKILLHPDGGESKQFDIKDGAGIVLAHRAGLITGLLSSRSSQATIQRATQLAIRIVRQNVTTKLDAYEQILAEHQLDDSQVAFMGDDLVDLPVLGRVGLAAAPADAVEDVRTRVHWVSRARGGDGAVRELIEVVLRAQDRWMAAVETFTAGAER
jgi:3-deoxy-D-manno-octulosonate 8-phosphate phosphatase (KDO 8-P phosphatase)